MTPKIVSSALAPLLAISFTAQFPAIYAVPADQTQSSGPAPDHTLHDGTPLKLRLSQTVSSADAKTGQEIPFEVVEELQIDGITVLAKGSTAMGVVTEVEPKRNMGRAGKLNMSISYARLKDSEKVALRAVKESKGGSHTGAMTGAIVATSLIIWPAAPFFLFIKGKDISIPQGTEITAFIDGDMNLDMSKFGAAPGPATAGPSSGSQVNLTIDSAPSGAEIDIDGNFVGSTPSTVPVTLGNHEITVRKKGFAAWTRKMNVAGGNVYLNAELEKSSQN